MIFCGCDLGSATGKAVVFDGETILSSAVVRSSKGPENTAIHAIEESLKKAGLQRDNVNQFVATGYGREGISFIQCNISEISCHAKGAYWLNPNVRTIIDIGGQDCKVISLNHSGKVLDFQMNDKCGAGTGRFFESMCRVLDCTLDELSTLALQSNHPVSISKQCGIFAESEVISLLNRGVNIQDIAAGVHEAVARRLLALSGKTGIYPDLVITGGCAKNRALACFLEKLLGMKVSTLSVDPQINGALGAALYAKEYAI